MLKPIISGFNQVCEMLEKKSGIRYEANINAPSNQRAIFGSIHFTGPLNMKNKIEVDISRIEKMAESASAQIVTVSYEDLENFTVNSYTINEILAEKIRSMMQRTKTRDYYDVWRMLEKGHGFDTELIGRMVRQKCTINEI